MKKLYLISILLLLVLYSQATAYYFSALSGRDSYEGSLSRPYQTLSKLNTLYPHPGDSLLLKSGEYFYGSIITTTDGTPGKPITIATYGGSAPAIVSGVSLITSWRAYGKGIWYTTINPQSPVNNVILDNKLAPQGRYPNEYPGTGGFLVYQAHFTDTQISGITSSQLPEYGIDSSYTGATLKVKSYLSSLESGEITAIKGNHLSFRNTNMFYQLSAFDNCGFFITNSLKTLDLLGEWYYSPKDYRLYMYLGDDPSIHQVEVSTTDILLEPRNNSYTIHNIVFRGANKYGISNNYPNKHQLLLEKIQVLLSGITAIAMANRSNIIIDSAIINGANTSGINVGYRCDSVQVLNSSVTNIGMLMANLWCDPLYQKREGYGIFSGVAPHQGIHVEGVKMSNIAYIGIFFTGSNNTIQRNTITNTCMYLDDGGAIYYGNLEGPGANNLIRRNIILNCQGYYYGYPTYHRIPNAIFVDDNGNKVMIDSNYVNGSGEAALYIHNGNNCTVEHNTFTNAALALIMMQDDRIGGRVYGNIIRYNDLFVTDSTQRLYCFYSSGDSTDNALTQYGIIDYNNLGSPNMLQRGIMSHVDTFAVPGVADYCVQDWQLHMPYDRHSITTAINLREMITYYTVDRDTVINLIGNWQRMDGTPVSSPLRLKDHTGIVIIKENSYIPITFIKKSNSYEVYTSN